MVRAAFCWIMMAVAPVSLMAADSDAAMLYSKGTTWLNGAPVPRSSAIFSGDLVQTKPDSIANINGPGSNVVVLADSLIKFEGKALSLEHGGVTIATTKGMSTRAGEVTVTPVSNGWTEFAVTETNGTVQIVAQKGDVSVGDQSGTTTLSQGQQTTRDQSPQASKKKRKGGGAVPAGSGSVLDSKTAILIGAAAAGGIVTWVVVQGDNPASPSKP